MNGTPDQFNELVERVSRDIETWQPEAAGDLLAGVVLKTESVQFSDGKTKILVTLRRESTDPNLAGTEISPGSGTVLQRAYRELDLQPGDLVVVQFRGEKPGQFGTPYKLFGVEGQRDGKPLSRKKAVRDDDSSDLVVGIEDGPNPFPPEEPV